MGLKETRPEKATPPPPHNQGQEHHDTPQRPIRSVDFETRQLHSHHLGQVATILVGPCAAHLEEQDSGGVGEQTPLLSCRRRSGCVGRASHPAPVPGVVRCRMVRCRVVWCDVVRQGREGQGGIGYRIQQHQKALFATPPNTAKSMYSCRVRRDISTPV